MQPVTATLMHLFPFHPSQSTKPTGNTSSSSFSTGAELVQLHGRGCRWADKSSQEELPVYAKDWSICGIGLFSPLGGDC